MPPPERPAYVHSLLDAEGLTDAPVTPKQRLSADEEVRRSVTPQRGARTPTTPVRVNLSREGRSPLKPTTPQSMQRCDSAGSMGSLGAHASPGTGLGSVVLGRGTRASKELAPDGKVTVLGVMGPLKLEWRGTGLRRGLPKVAESLLDFDVQAGDTVVAIGGVPTGGLPREQAEAMVQKGPFTLILKRT